MFQKSVETSSWDGFCKPDFEKKNVVCCQRRKLRPRRGATRTGPTEPTAPTAEASGSDHATKSPVRSNCGIHRADAANTLTMIDVPRNENHKHHNPKTLQPSFMVSGSPIGRPPIIR